MCRRPSFSELENSAWRDTPFFAIGKQDETVIIAISAHHAGVCTPISPDVLLSRFAKEIAAVAMRGLVVDFGGTHVLSLEMLPFLWGVVVRARRGGVRIASCNQTSNMRAVLKALKVDPLFPVYATRDDAVKAVTPKGRPTAERSTTDDILDPEIFVANYCDVIARLEREATEARKAEFQAIANRLRDQWKAWAGEDNLHELAFWESREHYDPRPRGI